MRDVGCIHIHMKMLYYCGQGKLDSAQFLTLTLPISVSVIGGQGELDNA